MNFKKIRKIRRNMKAISPIIATLLLIAIAVVAALVTYAWVMGYIGFQTSNAGNSVLIQNVNMNGDSLTVINLQNTGTATVTLNPFVFVNGVQDTATLSTPTLPGGSTATITLSPVVPVTSGSMVTIKVTITGGTYSQITQQAP